MIVKVMGHPPIVASSFAAYTSSDGAQVNKITAVADVAGSLNSKYFILPTANNEKIYVVYMDINSAGVDPKIENTTSVAISVATGATALTIGAELRSVLGALSEFAAGGAGAECDLTFATDGRAALAHDDSSDSTTSTGFTFTDTTPGTNAVPASTLYEIVGKIMVERMHFDASVTGSYRPSRYLMEDITLIVPLYQIVEVVEN